MTADAHAEDTSSPATATPGRCVVSTHVCPGCRRAQVARHRFACKQCWYDLPPEKRQVITDTYGRNPAAHLAAMTDAINWYASEGVR